MARPSVSIITPTYNRLHTLPRCWGSLKSQTLANFQWIVIDDGSSDGSGDWVKSLGDKRITYRQQTNQGTNIARNHGIKFIAGDYVIFLDSDDAFFKKTSLADMVREISRAEQDIGVVAFPYVDKDGVRRFDTLRDMRAVADYRDMLCENVASGDFISIIRREINAIAPFPAYRGVENVRHLALHRHSKTLFVNKAVCVYYDNAGDKTADNMTALEGILGRLDALVRGTRDILAQHKAALIAHCPPRYSRYASSLALYYLLQGKTAPAIPQLATALRYGNTKMRIKALGIACLVPIPYALRLGLFKLAWRVRFRNPRLAKK